MERYEKVKDYVYGEFHKIYNPALQTLAYTHTNSVDTCITLLAVSRGLNVELAKIAALFHDYAQFVDNCPHSQHAKLSSVHAHKFLTSMQAFKVYEIDDICFAISQHSKKEQYDSPLCEVLKDADILADFLQNPYQEFTGIKKERLLEACADLK